MPALRSASKVPPYRVRSALLAWFDVHKRDLPWRRTADPYAIWISEIMLQQTQVVTAIPYWERFLERFPNVQALSDAPLSEVLASWSGLGYYSRARNLHRAAQRITSELGGALPGDFHQLLALPGFGPYTAGAVASIAFGRRVPAVDGNADRVLCRIHGIPGAPGDRPRAARLMALAAAWADGPRPGDLNQALIELGATVCKKAHPACHLCPVRRSCAAHQAGRTSAIPAPKRRSVRKQLSLEAAVVRRGHDVLLARRASDGLFGGLWELPCAPDRRALRRLLGPFKVGKPLGTVERTLTHRDLTILLLPVEVSRPPKHLSTYEEVRWANAEVAGTLPISAAMLEAITLALGDQPDVCYRTASSPTGWRQPIQRL